MLSKNAFFKKNYGFFWKSAIKKINYHLKISKICDNFEKWGYLASEIAYYAHFNL